MLEGDIEHGAVMAGQIAPLITKEYSSLEIIDTVLAEGKKRLAQISNFAY